MGCHRMQKQKFQIWKPCPRHLKHSDIQESSLRPERFKGHVLTDYDGSRFLGVSCPLSLSKPNRSEQEFSFQACSMYAWDARALCSPWAERPDCQPASILVTFCVNSTFFKAYGYHSRMKHEVIDLVRLSATSVDLLSTCSHKISILNTLLNAYASHTYQCLKVLPLSGRS